MADKISENLKNSSSLSEETNVTDTPSRPRIIDELGRAYGTGRRKSSVARVWIKEGSGQFVVNDKTFADYFQPIQREHIMSAILASSTAGKFDVWCTVKGGGMSGRK